MIAASPSSSFQPGHIRRLVLSKDLDQVADLIELSFPIHLDQDGQTYIKEMRQAAREMRFMGWLSNVAEMGDQQAAGFVWEENGRIVGNLSLIPFRRGGQRITLIANVAVHPDFRRQGIARALTHRALSYLQDQNIRRVWLQVRDDNPAAIDLYRSVGFVDQYARTTWRIHPFERKELSDTDQKRLTVTRRGHQGWDRQKDWLYQAYPQGIHWNLPVDFNRFESGFLQSLANIFDNIRLKHWSVVSKDQCMGVITWQKTSTYADNLWLAFPEDPEAEVLPYALSTVLKRLNQRHPLSIDYPKGRNPSVFERIGFTEFRTLIWMSRSLHSL